MFAYAAIAFFLGGLVFVLLNFLYKNTEAYAAKFGEVAKFKRVPANLEMANLGSNHAKYGFNYDGLGVNGFNFALGPQYPWYDLALLKTYARHLKKGCHVLIVLPAAIFCCGDNCWETDKYYHFLPRGRIKDFSWRKKIGAIFPLLAHPGQVRRLLKDIPSESPVENTPAHCEKEAIARRDGWIKQFGLRDMVSANFSEDHLRNFEKAVALVSQMIDFCRENGFRPVLVIPPASAALQKIMGEEFLRVALYENIRKANVGHAPVLDYLHDARFSDPSLYLNSDFLNNSGAVLFTRAVYDDLHRPNSPHD